MGSFLDAGILVAKGPVWKCWPLPLGLPEILVVNLCTEISCGSRRSSAVSHSPQRGEWDFPTPPKPASSSAANGGK